MKKLKLRALVIPAVLVVLLAVGYAVYTRPVSLAMRYPALEREKCLEISGSYTGEAGTVSFTAERDSAQFHQLLDLLYRQKYRRRLRDLLPVTDRTHRIPAGDEAWEVSLSFESVLMPDGSTASGTLLWVKDWFGSLEIYFNGEYFFCRTADQEAWSRAILAVIQR